MVRKGSESEKDASAEGKKSQRKMAARSRVQTPTKRLLKKNTYNWDNTGAGSSKDVGVAARKRMPSARSIGGAGTRKRMLYPRADTTSAVQMRLPSLRGSVRKPLSRAQSCRRGRGFCTCNKVFEKRRKAASGISARSMVGSSESFFRKKGKTDISASILLSSSSRDAMPPTTRKRIQSEAASSSTLCDTSIASGKKRCHSQDSASKSAKRRKVSEISNRSACLTEGQEPLKDEQFKKRFEMRKRKALLKRTARDRMRRSALMRSQTDEQVGRQGSSKIVKPSKANAEKSEGSSSMVKDEAAGDHNAAKTGKPKKAAASERMSGHVSARSINAKRSKSVKSLGSQVSKGKMKDVKDTNTQTDIKAIVEGVKVKRSISTPMQTEAKDHERRKEERPEPLQTVQQAKIQPVTLIVQNANKVIDKGNIASTSEKAAVTGQSSPTTSSMGSSTQASSNVGTGSIGKPVRSVARSLPNMAYYDNLLDKVAKHPLSLVGRANEADVSDTALKWYDLTTTGTSDTDASNSSACSSDNDQDL